jgi:hypothetical protein
VNGHGYNTLVREAVRTYIYVSIGLDSGKEVNVRTYLYVSCYTGNY